jgi:methylamine dehydrogenase light chain
MKWMDSLFERSARNVATRNGRRSALGMIGKALVGTAALPLLPVDRQAYAAQPAAKSKLPAGIDDQASCDYWKHCAIDGYLCACCGGTSSSCPPGSSASPITWIGTCLNPMDGRNYIVSYNDCCGSTSCGHCMCNRNEREKPMYKLALNNDINWCMASQPSSYVCSVSVLLGVQEQ